MTDAESVRGGAAIVLPPRLKLLSLAAIIASISISGITFGLGAPLLSIILKIEGVEETWIGLSAAFPAVASFAIAPLVPGIIRRWGTAATMNGGLILALVATLLLPVFPNVWAWFPIRFAAGLGASILFIVSETWINQIVGDAERGRAVGIYIMALSAGIAAGPLILVLTGTEGWAPFIACASFYAVAAIPIFMARGLAPRVVGHPSINTARFVRLAPIATGAGLILGLIDATMVALFPLYALGTAIDQDAAMILLALYTSGGIVVPPLTGILADRFDRHLVLLGNGVLTLASIVLLAFAIDHGALRILAVFVLGGAAASLYSVGLTLLGQRFIGADLPAVNAVMISMFSFGSIVGPAMTGAAMDVAGMFGFPASLAATMAAYLLLVYLRSGREQRRPLP
ncbi:MAG: MFS transporter [Alphaproteobacteria bacterium]|nr:MFS transporter [Alphaproteobacteria bacterium]